MFRLMRNRLQCWWRRYHDMRRTTFSYANNDGWYSVLFWCAFCGADEWRMDRNP